MKNLAIIIIVVLTLTACKKNKDVDTVELDKTQIMLSLLDSTATLTATISPSDAEDKTISWSSSDVSVATVSSNGTITPLKYGSTIIKATAGNGQFAFCTVTVNVIGTVTFRTNRTWTVGDQTWSDAITATGAQKDVFDAGISGAWKADCRRNRVKENPELPDLFSWEAVNLYKEHLCPAPWRVPTKEDFIALDIALGGTGENGQILEKGKVRELYLDTWGGQLAGHAFQQLILKTDLEAWYWSQTEMDADRGYDLYFFPNKEVVYPAHDIVAKEGGFPVRCVK